MNMKYAKVYVCMHACMYVCMYVCMFLALYTILPSCYTALSCHILYCTVLPLLFVHVCRVTLKFNLVLYSKYVYMCGICIHIFSFAAFEVTLSLNTALN
jgi:hypothetical protein